MANHSVPLIAPSCGGGGQILARNSTKTLKCPKCNWHYKYQETLEIHMKEKHSDAEVPDSKFNPLIMINSRRFR